MGSMTHLLLNRIAPEFVLPTLGGGRLALSGWRGHVVVINFWSAECVWSRHADIFLLYRQLTWDSKGVRVLGIASNVNETEAHLRLESEARHLRYQVGFDYEHKVADLYKADFTPQFYVLDRQGIIRYIGAVDDATSENPVPKHFYVDRAVSALLDNRPPNPAETAPTGCKLIRELDGA
jgi:peroxiredoxin